jgi:hypothetical protein
MTKTETVSTPVSETPENESDLPAAGKSLKRKLTRSETASRLGVSVSEVRRREDIGEFRTLTRNGKGWVLIDEAEVDALRSQMTADDPPLTRKSNETYTPRDAAKVFDALDAGKTLIQCVKECMVMPTTVEELAIVYSRLNGTMLLPKAALDTINALPLEGAFPLRDADSLVAVLQTAAADSCKSCNIRTKAYCKACAIKLATKAMRDPIT